MLVLKPRSKRDPKLHPPLPSPHLHQQELKDANLNVEKSKRQHLSNASPKPDQVPLIKNLVNAVRMTIAVREIDLPLPKGQL